MKQKNRYNNRDISWLSFNYRILEEARDPDVPIYDRIKFLGIWSSNLDEFFRVRVASLQGLRKIKKKKLKKQLDLKPKKVVKKILETVEKHQLEYGKILTSVIIPELKVNGIILFWNRSLLKSHKEKLKNFFRSSVMSYLQPVMMEENKQRKFFLENKKLYLAVRLKPGENKADKTAKEVFSYVNIPSDSLTRFLHIEGRAKHYYIFLDDLVKANLDIVFPGYQILESYSIKLNRDADLNIEDEYAGDLVHKIQSHLKNRKTGVPSRFLYDKRMPPDMLGKLIGHFQLGSYQIIRGGPYHNLNDLMKLPDPTKGKLAEEKPAPLNIKDLEDNESMFRIIAGKDHLLHFPYHSYDYVLRFFNEAAIDPLVKTIKVTLYRVAENSLIVNALISAAKNGKKVIVFVEVKARFDEENNLYWADKMEEAGIKIMYSMPGLKVHAKIALIIRKDGQGKTVSCGFLGTGNFNEVTARIYADAGLLTSNRKLLGEIDDVFRYLEKGKEIKRLKFLLVSRFNLMDEFKQLIDQEIKNAENGKTGRIIIKMNNLEEKNMIDHLYEASRNGVKIDLIIRGICCLRPGVQGLSENITVTRIVDKYLEHARLFIFGEKGNEKMYMGSADWMRRNLHHRIEVNFPVLDRNLKDELWQMIELQLNDNTKRSILDPDLNNQKPGNYKKSPRIRAQFDFYDYLKNRSLPARQ